MMSNEHDDDPYGVTVPGFEPMPESRVTSIGVVDDITLDEARTVLPELQDRFATNARGVLVKSPASLATTQLAEIVCRRSYIVFYHRENKSFLCSVCDPDQIDDECFTLGMETGGSRVVDSILGETTMDGLLRVLDIPREALLGDPGPTPAGGQPPE